jgi:glycosyltransferase involved in cell wall biosynthesis
MERSLESVHKVICVSDYVKRYIKKSFNLTNLATVHNFIDYEGEINPQLTSSDNFNIRSDLDLPPDAKIITYFGRLIPEKGVDLLIKAFKRIHKKAEDNIYLLVGGEGSQRTQLENMAKETTGVIFTGFVPRKNQLATIAQSDVFVHPARYPEAFGITILEAMALGLPVVATRVGGIPEFVVDGKGGYLVTPNSSADLATKIYNVLNNEMFKSEAKAFNLELSRKFDIKHIGQKIIKIYESSLT